MMKKKADQQQVTQKEIPQDIEFEVFSPKSIVQQLSFMLIRPPKAIYNPQSLRPNPRTSRFRYSVHKIPFELSLYLPKRGTVSYVILYLHCNSSNRHEGATLVKQLPAGVGLACFDFEGCGLRDGKWVTLGVKQSKQVDIAAKWLKNQGYQVVGWGRSMGAVSLLLSSECNVMIADSAFSNLETLCRESGNLIPHVYKCLFDCFFPCAFWFVRRDITRKVECDIFEDLDIEKRVRKMSLKKAIMFISGNDDTMVDKKHSQNLSVSFKGYKKLLLCEGSHNSQRPSNVNRAVFKFIDQALVRLKSLKEEQTQEQEKPAVFQKTLQSFLETDPF